MGVAVSPFCCFVTLLTLLTLLYPSLVLFSSPLLLFSRFHPTLHLPLILDIPLVLIPLSPSPSPPTPLLLLPPLSSMPLTCPSHSAVCCCTETNFISYPWNGAQSTVLTVLTVLTIMLTVLLTVRGRGIREERETGNGSGEEEGVVLFNPRRCGQECEGGSGGGGAKGGEARVALGVWWGRRVNEPTV